MEDKACTSRPSITIDNTSIAIVLTLLDEDRLIMLWEIERVLGTLKRMLQHILTEYLISVLGTTYVDPMQKSCYMELCLSA